MTFFNEDGTVRTDSEDSVLEFLATNVSKKRRAKLLANVLYAKYAIESKDDILISDFFRILEKKRVPPLWRYWRLF